jgi:hypothetical protein
MLHYLTANGMDMYMTRYMAGNNPLYLDSTNLVALRSYLYQEQFDKGTFAIVPKCGELRIHFIKNVSSVGNHYHDILFTQTTCLGNFFSLASPCKPST